jgi:Fe2+ transport system protein FeoA
MPSHTEVVMTAVPVRLTDLRAGALARLHESRLDGPSSHLLRALGLVDASRIRLCQSGEPCIVQVRSTRIALSRVVAGHIYVIPESGRTV